LAVKIRGGKVTTVKAYENVIDREDGINRILTNVSIINLGMDEIHVVVNGGDEIPIDSNETLTLGDLAIDTLIVVEQGSTVKYIGIG